MIIKSLITVWSSEAVTPGVPLSAHTLHTGIGDFIMGYFKTPDWFVDGAMARLKDCEVRVIIFLCRVANKQGYSWYSQESIGNIIGKSERQVRRAIQKLAKDGYITLEHRKGQTTRIYLHTRFVEDVTPDTHVLYPGHR